MKGLQRLGVAAADTVPAATRAAVRSAVISASRWGVLVTVAEGRWPSHLRPQRTGLRRDRQWAQRVRLTDLTRVGWRRAAELDDRLTAATPSGDSTANDLSDDSSMTAANTSAVRLATLLAATVGVLVCCSAGSAATPRAALLAASERTNTARSMQMSLNEQITVDGKSETVKLSGVQQPAAHRASFVVDMTPAQPGLGQANEIERGASIYLHYPILDTLHAKDPAVRSWILINTNSSLGINPQSLAVLSTKELQALHTVKAVGTATFDGQPVTDYEGTLDLNSAAKLPQFAQLLSHLPSASAAILNGSAVITYAVGSDGYLHGMSTTISVKVQGAALKVALQMTLGAFNHANAPIEAPPADEVMTLSQFEQITGAGATPAETALLQHVVLKPAQVGAGFSLGQIPGGHLVQGETTLDFCGFSYPSEELRTARLQVAYSAKASSFAASNEVVTYTAGGTREALSEVEQAAAKCPQGQVADPPSGVTDLIRRTHVISGTDGLLPGSIAIFESDTALVHGKRVSEDIVLVFQIRGSVLSGVYGYGRAAAVVQTLTLRAAEKSAANLRRYVSADLETSPGGELTA